jgi:hypothetical protein
MHRIMQNSYAKFLREILTIGTSKIIKFVKSTNKLRDM